MDYFDFAVNEQCFEYDECNLLKPFISREKPFLLLSTNKA
ncbi:endo alpha-1,4 polygalactosaminidase [Reinekea marina]|uniref:Endo alpha-1,4 polygalactosaminidase n=1 Tax=Reinekea marina TaxID=1310421 RepID=A0ABV7WXY8_9GAMM|nr:endo alpha-1,4 polygalactosaminidase [Reinekea marina]MDN3647529.1 endo alpha-1,4 polygalactosaminidase [Reinekea marina]